MPGPNDFHGEIINGQWTAMPGLGADEPKVVGTILPEPPKVQELRKKAAELDAIEQQLAEREAALKLREAASA